MWSWGTGRRIGRRNHGLLCPLPEASDLALMFIHTGLFTFIATGMERCAIPVMKYISWITTTTSQRVIKHFLTVTSKRDNIPFVLTDFQIAQKLKPHWNTGLSTFTGGQGKKEKDVHFIWCFCLAQQQQSVQLHPFVLHGKGIFNTESHKTSNGIGRETTECSVINIKMPTNRQKKRRQKKSQQIYVHTHTHEEKSRQWIGEEAVMVGIDKPCIFTLW